jgi:hypothetical protein
LNSIPGPGEAAAPQAHGEVSLWAFWFLFAVAFIEGGALMAVEIVGAKLVGPYYGSSLYVWAAVLGLTLGGQGHRSLSDASASR